MARIKRKQPSRLPKEDIAIPAQEHTIEFRSSYTRKRTTASLSSVQQHILGSDTGGGIDLEGGEDILARHARLAVDPSGPSVEPIGEAPVALNGRPVISLTRLNDGDWLALGSSLFQVHFVAGEQLQEATPRLTEPAPAPANASDSTSSGNHRPLAALRPRHRLAPGLPGACPPGLRFQRCRDRGPQQH